MSLTTRRLDPTYATLGIAAHFVARHRPFSGFKFGDVVQTLDQQIRRGHSLFALDDQRVAGYLGWAVYSSEDAKAFATTGLPPPLSKPDGDDVAWVLMMVATSPEALKALVAAGRALNVGRRAMGVRYKPTGQRVIFDQLIRAPSKT